MLLFDRYSNERTRDNELLLLSFVDIKKAYFNGWAQRDVYMSPPRGLGIPADLLCKQIRCVYGTRDACMIWEETYRQALIDMGFEAGRASPCCFQHPTRGIAIVAHGDDFAYLVSAVTLTGMKHLSARFLKSKSRSHGRKCAMQGHAYFKPHRHLDSQWPHL